MAPDAGRPCAGSEDRLRSSRILPGRLRRGGAGGGMPGLLRGEGRLCPLLRQGEAIRRHPGAGNAAGRSGQHCGDRTGGGERREGGPHPHHLRRGGGRCGGWRHRAAPGGGAGRSGQLHRPLGRREERERRGGRRQLFCGPAPRRRVDSHRHARHRRGYGDGAGGVLPHQDPDPDLLHPDSHRKRGQRRHRPVRRQDRDRHGAGERQHQAVSAHRWYMDRDGHAGRRYYRGQRGGERVQGLSP